MDSGLFKGNTKWGHKYELEDTIKSIFDYLIEG